MVELLFTLDLDWTIFTMAGPGYHAAGEWTVSLKKVGDNKLMAMIGKSKVHSFMLHSGMTLTSLQCLLSKIKTKILVFFLILENQKLLVLTKNF